LVAAASSSRARFCWLLWAVRFLPVPLELTIIFLSGLTTTASW
jgi:hypothetical protein